VSSGDLAVGGTYFAARSHFPWLGFLWLLDSACTVIPCLRPSCARTCRRDMHCSYQNRQSFHFFSSKLDSGRSASFSRPVKSSIFFFFNHRGGLCFSSNGRLCGHLCTSGRSSRQRFGVENRLSRWHFLSWWLNL